MKRFAQWARTLISLGLVSILRVAWYRLRLKTRWFARHPAGYQFTSRQLFACEARRSLPAPNRARRLNEGALDLFSHFAVPVSGVPDWHRDPVADLRCREDQHWSATAIAKGSDIKCFWEASRWTWAPTLAQGAAAGNLDCLRQLNEWSDDWIQHNPPYLGVNWQCGQETSIRLLNALLAADLLGMSAPAGMQAFVVMHLKRILPTLGYALGQDNNHGTSEAAALFVGGAWLLHHQATDPESVRLARRVLRQGRSVLEERVATLVFEDGGFAQYSTNYHRVLLDTLSISEYWRRGLKQRAFSDSFYRKAKAATAWLAQVMDPLSGRVPNLGANDGARLLALDDSDYVDFRSSLQAASVLFDDSAIASGDQLALHWLNLTTTGTRSWPEDSAVLPDTGLVVLRRGVTAVYIRYSNFRFRPSHADCLHVDVFHNGVNVLTDSGTYSYHSDDADAFSGTAAHNTVVFDGRDQMPRLGKFLFGNWTSMDVIGDLSVDDEGVAWQGAYTDSEGCRHERRITLGDDGLEVEDLLEGRFERAMLYWHLGAGNWEATVDGAMQPGIMMSLAGASDIQLGDCVVSERYLQTSARSLLSARVDARVVTRLVWV